MRSLPIRYCPLNSLRITNTPEKTLGDAERLFADLGGSIEKRGKESITAAFHHPDGPFVRIKIKLYYITELGSINMDFQRHAGDALLAALVMRCLTKRVRGESVEPFRRGQIIPLVTMGPHASPKEPPSMSLEETVFPDANVFDESAY